MTGGRQQRLSTTSAMGRLRLGSSRSSSRRGSTNSEKMRNTRRTFRRRQSYRRSSTSDISSGGSIEAMVQAIYDDVAINLEAGTLANDPKNEVVRWHLKRVCEILEGIKRKNTGKKGDFVDNAVKWRAVNTGEDTVEDRVGDNSDRRVRTRPRSNSSSSDDVFLKVAPSNNDGDNDASGERIPVETPAPRQQCLSYSGYFWRITRPRLLRAAALQRQVELEEAKGGHDDNDEDPDEAFLRSIFYSEDYEEDREDSNFGCRNHGNEACGCTQDILNGENEPVNEQSSSMIAEEYKRVYESDTDDSVKFLYTVDDKVITFSGDEDVHNISSESYITLSDKASPAKNTQPVETNNNGVDVNAQIEPEPSKLAREGNSDQVEQEPGKETYNEDEDTEDIFPDLDIISMDTADEDPKTFEELEERVSMMEEFSDFFTMEDVVKAKNLLLKFVEGDRDMSDEEFKVYETLTNLKDRMDKEENVKNSVKDDDENDK